MPEEGRLREEARISEAILRALRILDRRKDAQLKLSEHVTNKRMFALSASTEGLGLFGDKEEKGKDGINLRDLKLYEELVFIVEGILEVCEPDEIPSIMNMLDVYTTDMMIRSKRLLTVESTLPIESWIRSFPGMKYQGMDQVGGTDDSAGSGGTDGTPPG
jgi:hypothetical protein